jgi:hypothetical protein
MANGLFNLKQVVQAVQQGGWPNQKPPTVEYLVVAGGGSGGSVYGGGGGAGGLLQGIDPVPNGQTLLVTVGAGGTGSGGNGVAGGASVFGTISAAGGGGGSTSAGTGGGSGGSGGGGGQSVLYTTQGIAGQGNGGGQSSGGGNGYGGGGGGAGTVGFIYKGTGGGGSSGGNGGAGVSSAISGTVTTYSGGGGGGTLDPVSQAGIGGAGGGGNGGGNNLAATAGTANTGGGGGGAYNATSPTGGSGIVIVSYPDVYAAATTVNATASTSGSGSISYNGSSAYSSVTTPVLGSGDWTIEFWIYLNSVTTTFYYDGRGAGTSGLQPTIYYSSGVGLKYFTNGVDAITGSTLSSGQWYHIAVARSGTSTKMFINGTQTGSTYTDTSTYVASSTGSGWVMGNSSFYANGYMTNMRIVVGTAVYTTTFTPPTAPLTPISGTQLLLSSVSGAYLIDSSSSSRTVTNVGPPTWNQLSPFATGLGYKNRVYTWTTSGSITF